VIRFESIVVTEAGIRDNLAKKCSVVSTSVSSMIIRLKHCIGCTMVLNVMTNSMVLCLARGYDAIVS